MSESTQTQEPMTAAEPQEEHRWLERLVGEWDYEMDAPTGEGEPAMKVTGTESGRSLGGLWVVLSGRGEMPGGGEGLTQMTLGYDPRQGKYVGSWVGSMMTHLWVYEGRLRADGKALELESDGPDMKGEGKTVRYLDRIEMVSDDERTLTGHVRGDDGSWQPLMTARYRRRR